MYLLRILFSIGLIVLCNSTYGQADFPDVLYDNSALIDAGLNHEPGVGKLISDDRVHLKQLKMAVATNDQKAIAFRAGTLGTYYLRKREYGKALNFLQQALNAERSLSLKRAEAITLSQMGLAFYQKHLFDQALSSFDQSLKLLKNEKFEKALAPVAYYAGQSATRLQQYELAETYYATALKSYQEQKESTSSGKVLNALGELFLITDAYDKALLNFKKANDILASGSNGKQKAIVLRNIGLTYFKRGVNEKALDYFNRSLSLDQQLLVSKLKKEALMKLFTVHSFNKEYDKADGYHELYRSLKDSLSSIKPHMNSEEEQQAEGEERALIIAMLERKTQEQQVLMNQKDLELSSQITATDIERQNKEKALEQLQLTSEEKEVLSREKAIKERDLAVKELQLSRQKAFRNLLFSVIGIILILGYFIYNRYRSNKVLNTKLGKANAELASTLNELRRTQDQLIHSEKLASLGQMTAGIAHEIKNPLNFINNFSSVTAELMTELAAAEEEKERELLIADITQNMKRIEEHSKRADSIVKNMLMHSRSNESEKLYIDVNSLLEESYHLAYQSVVAKDKSAKAIVQYYLDPEVPQIKGSGQELERVFINILENAFYAMKKKKIAEPGYEPVISILSTRENEGINIKISDNASGIPADILSKIFQPFFTTKPAGEGTGLGLSLCYDIITKGHNGTIEVKSEPGSGTIFIIRLPAV